VDKPLGITQ